MVLRLGHAAAAQTTHGPPAYHPIQLHHINLRGVHVCLGDKAPPRAACKSDLAPRPPRGTRQENHWTEGVALSFREVRASRAPCERASPSPRKVSGGTSLCGPPPAGRHSVSPCKASSAMPSQGRHAKMPKHSHDLWLSIGRSPRSLLLWKSSSTPRARTHPTRPSRAPIPRAPPTHNPTHAPRLPRPLSPPRLN